MIINAANNSLKLGQMRISGQAVGSVDSPAQGLTLSSPAAGTESAAGARKISIYDNFAKEMTKRLTEAGARTAAEAEADPAVLAQSLSGAMGEIEKLFGREAATEVMAKVLNGTADRLNENTLIQSLQNGLADLSRLDPNGSRMKQLTEAFNADLTLAFDPDLAEEKLESGETLSLSYALSRHFGTLITPESKDESAAAATDDEEPRPAFGSGGGLTVIEGFEGGIDLAEATASLAEARTWTPERVERQPGQAETHEMFGFGVDGRWGLVEIAEPDQVAEAELKEAAEAGLAQAQELDLAQIIGQGDGKGLKVLEELSKFLKLNLQDDEAAAFVDKSIKQAQDYLENKYGTAPNLTETLSQVYAKVAAEGDADKLTALTNYVNTDFKDGLNPILAEMQTGMVAALGGAEIGELQFKGLIGPGAAGETDTFSLKWGYKEDEAFDKTYSRRYLDEDIQAVKSAGEDQQAQARRNLELARAQMADEAELRKAGFVGAVAQPEEVAKANKELGGPIGYHVPGYSHIDADPGVNNKIWDETALPPEGGSTPIDEAERQKLIEIMTMKYGQAGDEALAKIEKYLSDFVPREETDEVMAEFHRTREMMSGLAVVHQAVREGAGEAKAAEFVSFLNNEIKDEVGRAAGELGLEFDGWESLDGASGELTAAFRIQGTDRAATVTILGPEARPADGSAEAILRAAEAAEQEREAREIPKHLQKPRATGYLIDLMA